MNTGSTDGAVGDRGESVAPPPLPFHSVNEQGVVTHLVACRGCGYVLKGFTLAQVCPECGWPVSESVQGTGLFHTPPAYLRTLRSAILIILISLMVDIFPTFAVVILDIINDNFKMRWDLQPYHIAAEAISFVSNLVTVWGFWRFTTPDPTLSRTEQRTSAYWVLRIATIVAALSGFIETISTVLGIANGTRATGFMETMESVLSVLVYVLTAAWLSAAMHFVSAIAERVPDAPLARHAKIMVWLTWVLMFPGMLACFAGPIACVIYFFVAMVRLRAHIGRVLTQQEVRVEAGSA